MAILPKSGTQAGRARHKFPQWDKTLPETSPTLDPRQNITPAAAGQAGEKQMKAQSRFVQSVIRTAQSSATQLPWARRAPGSAKKPTDRSMRSPSRVKTA